MEGVVVEMPFNPSFYEGKTVLVTGHTGFKGAWLCSILTTLGARVVGYALEPPTTPSLFALVNLESRMCSKIGDIRDQAEVQKIIQDHQPEIIFHLAAQPLVLDGYKNPHYTYETNVMGTVNVLEASRLVGCVKSLVNITTDKVYLNEEREGYAYQEDDCLNGYDPYSNSKSCADLVTQSYTKSFLREGGVATSIVRAGNVIGGGDFASNRIVPDCVRAVEAHKPLVIRNPHSVRPYQHVLEPLFAYLLIAQKQYDDESYAGIYNIGPDDKDCVSTGKLVELFSQFWGAEFTWENHEAQITAPHEAQYLKLDSSKAQQVFGWSPQWNIAEAISSTVDWAKAYLNNDDIVVCMNTQIDIYMKGFTCSRV